ncbi:MAG: FHA domain-containing protein [Cyanobacteria bacterium P01_A01_bin.84]
MQVRLTWEDPNTGQVKTPVVETPIAIGRDFSRMPKEINGKRVARMTIDDDLIADYHFLIDWQNGQLVATNQYVLSGVSVNHRIGDGNISGKKLEDGDRINISACEITVNFVNSSNLSSNLPEKLEQDPELKFRSDDKGVTRCNRMVGFLVKRRCDRTDRTGCDYCSDINHTDAVYEYDYAYYENYGDYSSGYWGHTYYRERHKYSYDPQSGNVDFTEADAESFTSEEDREFEVNFDVS